MIRAGVARADAPAGSVCSLAVGDLAAGASGTAAFVVTVGSDWSVGATAIDNTVDHRSGRHGCRTGGQSRHGPGSRRCGQIDLAVSIVDDGAKLRVHAEGSIAGGLYHELHQHRWATRPASPQLTVEWSQGGVRDPVRSRTQIGTALSIPTRWRGSTPVPGTLASLGIRQSGSVTFTLYTGYFLPDSLPSRPRCRSPISAGGQRSQLTNNNSDLAVTPIQVDYSVILGSTVITVPEGSLATNSGLLTIAALGSEFPPALALFPEPSAGEYTR